MQNELPRRLSPAAITTLTLIASSRRWRSQPQRPFRGVEIHDDQSSFEAPRLLMRTIVVPAGAIARRENRRIEKRGINAAVARRSRRTPVHLRGSRVGSSRYEP